MAVFEITVPLGVVVCAIAATEAAQISASAPKKEHQRLALNFKVLFVIDFLKRWLEFGTAKLGQRAVGAT